MKLEPGDPTAAGIRAGIAAYELQRGQVHRRMMLRLAIGYTALVLSVAAMAVLFNTAADPFEQWTSSPHLILYVVAIFAALIVYFRAVRPASNLQQAFRAQLLPQIFGFVEDFVYGHGSTPDSFGRLPAEVVGIFNRERFDDIVSGRYEGFGFELYEAVLENKVGKHETQTFRGVIVAFETVAPFPGLLVATRKSDGAAELFRSSSDTPLELRSGVPEIDRDYKFLTDNPEAARPLVTGPMAQALALLRETWPDEPARVALSGRDGFLVVPLGKDVFELPGISAALDYGAHVEPLVAEMGTLLATAALVRKIGFVDEGSAPPPA